MLRWLTLGVGATEPPKTEKPPVADADGPYAVPEGSSVLLDGTGSSDPDGDPLILYEWDLDNDGQYDDATGMNPIFSAASFPSCAAP